VAHRGQSDRAEIEDLKRRLTTLEQTVESLLRVHAREYDAIQDRVRELELAP
jgi:hypothetical protein